MDFLNSAPSLNPFLFLTLLLAIALPILLFSYPRFLQWIRSSSTVDVPKVLQLVRSHEKKAARLSVVEEVRTVVDSRARGVLSLFSQKNEGDPTVSTVYYACDADGCPILSLSSVTTEVILDNPKCSLTVAKDPDDVTDLVVTLQGHIVSVADEEKADVHATYLKKHPTTLEVDSDDFQFVRIKPTTARYVSTAATSVIGSGEFSNEEFKRAKPDPIAQFSKPVASHMNKDHEEDTKLIVRHSTSLPVDSVFMLDLDSLGFNIKASYQGNSFKLRIPFPRRAEDRKDVKTLIVEMLQAAEAAVKVPS